MITQAVLLFYGFVNIAVTKINGVPVYPILTFDSVKSWAIAFCLPLMDAFFHFLYFLLTRWRLRKYLGEQGYKIYISQRN